MSKKEIKINPSFLQYGSFDGGKKKGRPASATRKNENKKKEELLKVNDSSVRDLLLKRLKEYRKNKTKKQEPKHGQNQNVSSEFMQALRKKKNKTANSVKMEIDEPKTRPPSSQNSSCATTTSWSQPEDDENNIINLDDPNAFSTITKSSTTMSPDSSPLPRLEPEISKVNILPEPQYSNLKNSDRPTFREFYNKPLPKSSCPNDSSVTSLETSVSVSASPSQTQLHKKKPTQERIEIAVEKVFKVGKNKTQKKIGIFIKNNKIKRKNEEDKVKLKRTNFKTVKNYLKKNNLVKYGTKAPTDLLRAIYESSKIVGDVKNVNGDNLIHNYVNDNE